MIRWLTLILILSNLMTLHLLFDNSKNLSKEFNANIDSKTIVDQQTGVRVTPTLLPTPTPVVIYKTTSLSCPTPTIVTCPDNSADLKSKENDISELTNQVIMLQANLQSSKGWVNYWQTQANLCRIRGN